MSSSTSDAHQQQMPAVDDVVTREELDAVVRQLVLAAQKSIESQLSNESAAAQYDSMLRQVEMNALQASDDGLNNLQGRSFPRP
jgi:hypothetical protein